MYDPKLYIVSLTITTGIVPQVFEVLEVRASPPPPLLELTSKHLPNPYLF